MQLDIVPQVPFLPADQQVTAQPQFLPGTLEAAVEEMLRRISKRWALASVNREAGYALCDTVDDAGRLDMMGLRYGP